MEIMNNVTGISGMDNAIDSVICSLRSCTFLAPYGSQNSPPEGNGVHFMFADVSRPVFSEESEGADHFLKKGAQHAHFGPFLVHSWAKLKRLCCLT